MNIFLVGAHPEPQSFNGALFREAERTLAQAGHSVRVSDLHAMAFNPVSGRHNFTTVKDPAFFKQQHEEIHATEVGGFAPDIEAELEKIEWCDLMIWQFPLWWFGLPGTLKGWVDRVFAMGRTYGGVGFTKREYFEENGRYYRLQPEDRATIMKKAAGMAISMRSFAQFNGECWNSWDFRSSRLTSFMDQLT
jgi:putative NADPH-quinone reductase